MTSLPREPGRVSPRTTGKLWAHNIARTTQLSGLLVPDREPLSFGGYVAAAIIFALAAALFLGAWVELP